MAFFPVVVVVVAAVIFCVVAIDNTAALYDGLLEYLDTYLTHIVVFFHACKLGR